jgi:hypothetical protein
MCSKNKFAIKVEVWHFLKLDKTGLLDQVMLHVSMVLRWIWMKVGISEKFTFTAGPEYFCNSNVLLQ